MRRDRAVYREIWLISAFVLFAAALGLLLDLALEFITVAMFLVICFWIYQIKRLMSWMSTPGADIPESLGIWGMLYDTIYRQTRINERAKARLQSSIDYLRSSFASVRDAVVMVDKNGAIEWSNQAARVILGLRHPEDEGEILINLIRDPEFVAYFLSEQYLEPFYFEFNSADDIHLEVEISKFGKGDTLLFFKDITSRVRADRMRSDFASNVSHELRTPLTVIKGYVQTLLTHSIGEDSNVKKALTKTDTQIVRMENLITDLLWLARIERKKGRKHDSMIDIEGLLREIQEGLVEIHGDRIRIQAHSSRKINGDRRELYSAISNLILNALNYSDVDTLVEVIWGEDGVSDRLDVKDSGIGIEASHIPRLTERFYRIDESRTLQTGGTGLGLAIVKHVAGSHDAKLEVASKLGSGSTFSLIFSGREH